MVKKRDRPKSPGEIESFIAGGDESQVSTDKPLDELAPRSFKAVKFGMNEFEYNLFKAAAQKSGRSLLNFLRYSALKEANKNI
jgi:hypothetical protein